MKIIKLTREKYTIVDDEDYNYLSQWKWFSKKGLYGFYAVRWSTKNEHKTRKRYMIYMHRVLLNLSDRNSRIKGDHIDTNSLNNQRSNLRIATQSQNVSNWIRKRNNTGYRGVCYHSRDKKFQASIQINGKLAFLGSFNNPIDAAKRYDLAASYYFGEFTHLNFKEQTLPNK